jgi:hypothetical protein
MQSPRQVKLIIIRMIMKERKKTFPFARIDDSMLEEDGYEK